MLKEVREELNRIVFDWGYVEYGATGINIVSTKGNPPKISLASSSNCVGVISFNMMRSDGIQAEQGRLLLNMESYGPEFSLLINDGHGGNDSNMKRVMEASIARGVTFFVPVQVAS